VKLRLMSDNYWISPSWGLCFAVVFVEDFN